MILNEVRCDGVVLLFSNVLKLFVIFGNFSLHLRKLPRKSKIYLFELLNTIWNNNLTINNFIASM